MSKKISIPIYFILISLSLSIILSTLYVYLYDTYHLNGLTHVMLKEETYAHWSKASKIIKQIENGDLIFTAGEEMFTKPLPQRLVALYAYVLNFDIMKDELNTKIALGNKLPFLIIQSTIYYASVYFFFIQLSKTFDARKVLIIVIFLCVEPTIFQYHSSFWTESFYFSLQLLLFSLMINNNNSKKYFIIIGLILGLLFMQRSAGIFYIFPVLLYYFFTLNDQKYKKIITIFLTYITICIILGSHNYFRAGTFYIMPLEGKYSMYRYFAKDVLASSKNKTVQQIDKDEVERAVKWIKNEFTELNYKEFLELSSPLDIAFAIKNEKYRIKYYNYLSKRSYEILLDNPQITISKIIKNFFHFSILNPFFVFYDYEYYKNHTSSEIGDFTSSVEHKKLIPTRIMYSIIIYYFVILGFFICIKKDQKLFFLIVMSVLYYYIILGWYGKTRLFVPNLIYLSIFFGLGLENSLRKLNLIK